MRPWMEKWGSVMLILLCALVILLSALYTRQDDLRRIAAQNAAADQNETLIDLPTYQPPVAGEVVQSYTGAYKTAQGLWQMDPYVHYEVRKGARVQSVCSGTVIAADEKQIMLETRDQLIFCLRGAFSLSVRAGDTVAAGQEIAICEEAGELLLSLSRDGHYLDPLSLF